MKLPSLLLFALTLAGCGSTPVVPLPRTADDSGGEVVIFREWAFAAGGVSVAVGTGGGAFASLGNSEKARAVFPPGAHEIFVQALSAEPSTVRVMVKRGATVCLRTSASPSTSARFPKPREYDFYIDEVRCPSAAELARYKDVAVSYQ